VIPSQVKRPAAPVENTKGEKVLVEIWTLQIEIADDTY